MRPRHLLPLLLTALAVLCACGGGGGRNLNPEAAAAEDLEGNMTAKKPRRAQTRSVNPAEIPLLSLDGLIKEPPAEGTEGGSGEEGTPQGPTAGGQGTAAPPKPGTTPAGVQPGGTKTPQGTPPGKGTPAPPGAPPPQPDAPAVNLIPRNLFAFEEDPAVVAERQRKAAEAAQVAAAEAKKRLDAQRKWQGPPPPPPPPQPPAIPFQFIGYLGPPEHRIGVFSGTGAAGVTLAKKGDTLMTQFKIVDIGYESAEIGFTNFKQTQRIPLTGGK